MVLVDWFADLTRQALYLCRPKWEMITNTTNAVNAKTHTMKGAQKALRPSRKRYATLEPRVKNLKEATIRKKWKKLPHGTQMQVADLLRAAERPTLACGGNDRKNMDVQAIVCGLVEG
jgi:hypothetical protein